MRLFPRNKARERIRQEKTEAARAITASRRHRRTVEDKQAHVDRVVGLLNFYSTRNGFADAFEEALVPREGRGGHEVGG